MAKVIKDACYSFKNRVRRRCFLMHIKISLDKLQVETPG